MRTNLLESAATKAPAARRVRLPSALLSRRSLSAPTGTSLALYLEAFGLGFLITAVSGVLPLIMLLHR